MSVHWLLVVEERESSAKTETNRPTQEELLQNQKRSEQNAKGRKHGGSTSADDYSANVQQQQQRHDGDTGEVN